MNTEIAVSVIIPICNVEKYLRKCLDSVCEQTLKNIEIICVEDHSSDSSAEILKEYAERDGRIIVIYHSENLSTSQSRKDGVTASHGKYVMFLDGDDELVPEACEKAYHAIEEYQTDMVQFDTEIINCAGVPRERIEMNQRLLKPCIERIEECNLILASWLEKKFGFTLWNKIYNGDLCRTAFQKIKDGSFPKAQDLYAFFVIAHHAKSYMGIEEKLYCYKFGLGVTGCNFMAPEKYEILLTEKRVWECLEEFAREENMEETYRPVLDMLYEHFLTECVNRWKENLQVENLSEGFAHLVEVWGLQAVIGKLAAQNWIRSDLIAEKIAETNYFEHKKRMPGQPLTVAMCYRSIKNGGAQRVVASLCNIWAEMRDSAGRPLYKVVLITDEEEGDNEELPEYELNPAVKRAYIPSHNQATEKLYIQRYLGWERVIREHHIDVVVSGLWSAGCALWDMLSVKGQPSRPAYVIHCHSFTCVPYRFMGFKFAEMMYDYKISDGVVVLSETDRRLVSCFADHSKCIANPLTFSVQNTQMTHRKKNTLVWVGRLSAEKQPLDMAYMMAHVVKKIPDARLYLIGSGDDEIQKELEMLIERLGIQENLILVGFTSEVEKYYQEASVFVGTSEYEGFSLVFCEAMAYGIPVVTYEIPWLTLSQDGRGIIQVQQKRTDYLADKVVELLEDPDRAEKLGREGREQIAELQQTDIGQQWRDFFEEISVNPDSMSDRNPDEIEKILLTYTTVYAEIGKELKVNGLENRIKTLNNDKKRKLEEIKKLKQKCTKLEEQNKKLKQQRDESNAKLRAAKNSITFKIGKVIMFIPRKIAKIFRKDV